MNDNNVLVSPFKTVYLFLMIMCGNYSPEEQNCILIKSKHFQFFAANFTWERKGIREERNMEYLSFSARKYNRKNMLTMFEAKTQD